MTIGTLMRRGPPPRPMLGPPAPVPAITAPIYDDSMCILRVTESHILERLRSRKFVDGNEHKFERVRAQKEEKTSAGLVKLVPLDLSNEMLHFMYSSLSDYSGTKFHNSYLFLATFNGCMLRRTSFRGKDTNIMEVDFTGSDMTRADLSYAKAQGARFCNIGADGMNFNCTNVAGARFPGTDLRKARNLERARNLDLAYFSEAILNDSQKKAVRLARAKRLSSDLRKTGVNAADDTQLLQRAV